MIASSRRQASISSLVNEIIHSNILQEQMNVIQSQYLHLKHRRNNVLFSSYENVNLNHLQ